MKYKVTLAAIAICMTLTLLTGTSYAVWKRTYPQQSTNQFQTGCFQVSKINETSSISLTNTYPMTDANGLSKAGYTMTVKNTCNISASLTVVLNVLNTTSIALGKMKVDLTGGTGTSSQYLTSVPTATPIGSKAASSTTAYTLSTDTLNAGAEKSYTLKLWIDYTTAGNEVSGQSFYGNMVIQATAVS